MSQIYAIFCMLAAGAIAVMGARDTFAELREGPESMRVPGWWLWGGPLWRAYERTSLFSWLFVGLIAPAAAIEAFGGDGDVAAGATTVLGALLAIDLFFAFSAALFGRPRALIPARLRDGPNLFTEWISKEPEGKA